MAAARDLSGIGRNQRRIGRRRGDGGSCDDVWDRRRHQHLVSDQSARGGILSDRYQSANQRDRGVPPQSTRDRRVDPPDDIPPSRFVVRGDAAHAAAAADCARRARRADCLVGASAQRPRRRQSRDESAHRLVLVGAGSSEFRSCGRACRVTAGARTDVAAFAVGSESRNRNAGADPRARRKRPAMNRPITIVLCMATALLAGCDDAPGRRAIDTDNVAPDKILAFDVLYRANCAGCHGPNGRGGAAFALANPTYVAIADAGVIRRVTADGIVGTPMPAFARRSGGMLTDEQIDAIVTGIRTRWTNPRAIAGIDLPPYADELPGDSGRGADVFATYCASCHGDGGRGARGAGSIVDGAYLALVSDQ